jgi:transcriptional regulator with XRE-family HTH domain
MKTRLSVNPRRRAVLQREVGARIRAIRTAEKKWSIAELAERTAMRKQDISKLELGAGGTTLERYEAIARALGVSLASLFLRRSA